MASFKSTSDFEVTLTLQLSESEARALHALTEYSTKSFLEYFYANLGRSCLEPNEKGLVSLFESVRKEIPFHLSKIDETRKLWNE